MAVDQEQVVVTELALLEGQRRWDETTDRLRYSNEYAQAGLKGLFLANGAAIIALLTFVGNSKRAIDPSGLWWSFAWFSVGLAMVLFAYICAYLSQDLIMKAVFKLSRAAESAAHGTKQHFDHRQHENAGECAVKLALGSAVGGLLSFICGAFVALDAIV